MVWVGVGMGGSEWGKYDYVICWRSLKVMIVLLVRRECGVPAPGMFCGVAGWPVTCGPPLIIPWHTMAWLAGETQSFWLSSDPGKHSSLLGFCNEIRQICKLSINLLREAFKRKNLEYIGLLPILGGSTLWPIYFRFFPEEKTFRVPPIGKRPIYCQAKQSPSSSSAGWL